MSITKSPWVIHYDGSSCNGCDIEVLACLTPMYDVERFGIINTGNPKHADVFLVTGSVNAQNISVVRQIYDQMPSPKVVVAIGVCASTGGIFRECYNTLGGVDQAIPVDVYVPGCAARPEAIIDGVVKGLGVLAEKQAALSKGAVDAYAAGGYLYEGPHDEHGTLVAEEAAEAAGAAGDVAGEAKPEGPAEGEAGAPVIASEAKQSTEEPKEADEE